MMKFELRNMILNRRQLVLLDVIGGVLVRIKGAASRFQALQKQLQESEEQIPQKTKKAKRKRKPNAELADPKSSDNPVIVESIESSAKAAKKKKQKKEKKTITVVKTQDGSELSDSSPKRDTIISKDVPNANSSTKAALDRSDAEIEKAVTEESSTTDSNTSEQGMGHEFSIHDPLAQKLTFTEEIDDKGVKSKEVASQKSDAGVNTLSEIKALRDNTLRLSSNGLSKTNGLALYVEKKTEKPKTSKNSGKTTATKRSTAGKTVSSPEKKSVGKVAKRKNKLAKKGDESKSSTKTQSSKSTSKSATPKSERRETKCKLHHEANQSMSCPRPLSESQKKKSVTIDMTRNMAVGHRELKISPESPFSPSKRPNKSALKTPPCTHRCKAKDFF